MSTALVLSNQNLLVNIDYNLQMKDFYFPHVGQENQLNQYVNKMFFWIDGRFFYTGSSQTKISIDYQENSAIGLASLEFSELPIRIEFKYYVLVDRNIYVREFKVINNDSRAHQIKLFFQCNFAISESNYADTVVWYQPAGALIHYKNDRFIAIASKDKIYQFSCAAKSDNSGLGAYPDKDGELKYNVVSTGNVNSCLSYLINLDTNSSYNGDVCVAAGRNLNEVEKLLSYYRQSSLTDLENNTTKIWRKLLVDELNQLQLPKSLSLEDQKSIRNQYWRSIVQLISQIDKDGCIVAANDGQYLKDGGTDTYSYYWPRDGANTILALNRLGQHKLARRCLNYALRATAGKGYFMHKYFPSFDEGKPALGSSWHTWVDYQGKELLPIQEDATALALIAISDYYHSFKDTDFLKLNWNNIEAIIKFLKSYNFAKFQPKTSINTYVSGFKFSNQNSFASKSTLPYPSYDIWEQYLGVFSHTAILLLEAIKCSINLVEVVKAKYLKEDLIIYYKALKKDILTYLVDNESNTFIKGISFAEENKLVAKDTSADAALFDAYNVCTDKEIRVILQRTIARNLPKLELKNEIGGIARKENDHYLHLSGDYQGNPWLLTSLWMSQAESSNGNLQGAMSYLNWVISHTDKTGVMAEQVNPYTGFGLGVKPLTWNHAEYIKAVLMLSKNC